MNIERLNTIVSAISEDLQAYNFVKRVVHLANAIQNRLNEPANAQVAQATEAAFLELRENLPKLRSNTFPPTWREHMDKLGLKWFVGNELLQEIQRILDENRLTTTVAQTAVAHLGKSLQEKLETLRQLTAAFSALNIARDEPSPGEAEFGMLIPRAAVSDSSVTEFGKEVLRVPKLVGVFQELATGSRAEIKIASIASSDLSLFLQIDPATARLMLDCISVIIEGFKNILDIQKTLQDLREKDVPGEVTEPLVQHANRLIQTTITKTTEDVIDKSAGKTTRKAELKIELRSALHEIAVRIDRGYNFEIRATADTVREGGTPDQTATEIEHIATRQNTIAFDRTRGAPILALTSRTDSNTASEQAPPEPKRRTRKTRRKPDKLQ